jgi:hypothetical protein
VLGGAVTEEITVVQLKTGHTTFATSKGTKNKFDEVTAERDDTEELYVEQQNAVHTALASHKYFENNCTVLKKISVEPSLVISPFKLWTNHSSWLTQILVNTHRHTEWGHCTNRMQLYAYRCIPPPVYLATSCLRWLRQIK